MAEPPAGREDRSPEARGRFYGPDTVRRPIIISAVRTTD